MGNRLHDRKPEHFISFHVQDVMPVTSARLADISRPRVRKHLSRDSNSHSYQHLQQSQACRGLATKNCFSIVNCAPQQTTFDGGLMLKEAMHIKWENPTLTQAAET